MKQRQPQLIKMKTESGNCFCIRIAYSIKLRIIIILHKFGIYRKTELKKRKEETDQQSSTGKRVREKNTKETFFVGRTT